VAGRVDRWRPRSWLDAFGFLLELIGLVVFMWSAVLVIRSFNGFIETWPWPNLISIGAFAISFLGFAIRRWARREPLFRRL